MTRTDGPFLTPRRAQEAVRQSHAKGELPSPVTVLVRGVHRLREPLVFTPEDSGTEKCPGHLDVARRVAGRALRRAADHRLARAPAGSGPPKCPR